MTAEPLRLTDRVWLVGSGDLGCQLTSRWDCNVYLVRPQPGSWVVVDAGCGRAGAAIAEAVEQTIGDDAVEGVVLTHAHADHAAGVADLAHRLQCTAYASPEVAAIVTVGDAGAAGLTDAKVAGVYPADLAYPAGAVVPIESDHLGGLACIPTPGHAVGHLCFALDGASDSGPAVFTGDLVFARGRLAVLDTPDTDTDRLRRSLEQIRQRAPGTLFPGHCEPVFGRADDCLRRAIDDLDHARVRGLT